MAKSCRPYDSRKNVILQTGCRGAITNRRVIYLATVLDQFDHPNYRHARRRVREYFSARNWAIFEPARCDWTTTDWLKVWPRLRRWIDALVIWPRPDGSVGFGVFEEARDIQHAGRPVYVLTANGKLKLFVDFKLFLKNRNPVRYAGVKTGKLIKPDEMSRRGG